LQKLYTLKTACLLFRVTSVVVNNDTDDYAGCRKQYSPA
jgi:hypothetical protein